MRIGLHCFVKDHAKAKYERIYKVLIMKRGVRGITQYYSAFTKDEYIANDLEDEPWTSNIISGLHAVSSGRHVALGPGARGNSTSMEESSLYFPERTSTGWQKFWFDARNSNKKCIEGAFSNLVHHMQDHKVAIIIKNIATQSNPFTDCIGSWS